MTTFSEEWARAEVEWERVTDAVCAQLRTTFWGRLLAPLVRRAFRRRMRRYNEHRRALLVAALRRTLGA